MRGRHHGAHSKHPKALAPLRNSETATWVPGTSYFRASGSPVPLPLGHRALRWPRGAHQPPHAPPHHNMLVQTLHHRTNSNIFGQKIKTLAELSLQTPGSSTDRCLPAEGDLKNRLRPMRGAQLYEGSTWRPNLPQSQGNPAP